MKQNEYWVGKAKPIRVKRLPKQGQRLWISDDGKVINVIPRMCIRHKRSGNDATSLRMDALDIFKKAGAWSSSGHWVVNLKTMGKIKKMKNRLGQSEFPSVIEKTPSFLGYWIRVSSNVKDDELMFYVL